MVCGITIRLQMLRKEDIMKKTHKILSVFCLIAMLISTVALTFVGAAEYVIEKPVEPSKWENPQFDDPEDFAYSFAFVGDTQFTVVDSLEGQGAQNVCTVDYATGKINFGDGINGHIPKNCDKTILFTNTAVINMRIYSILFYLLF